MSENDTRLWIFQGREKCPFCLQLYLYEEELRCSACDIQVCPCCAASNEHPVVICPVCSTEKGE